MKHILSAVLAFLFISCSSPDKESKVAALHTTNLDKAAATSATPVDTNWVTYKDTINMGFVVSFKYPKHLYAEHFENAECIGKRIKMVDDGPMTTMNCSMWMDDIADGNVRPIDTLIEYELQTINTDVEVYKDSIDIAGVKGLRARFFDRKDNTKPLRQSIFFTKYNTFFDVENDSLPINEFDMFVQSLRIDK